MYPPIDAYKTGFLRVSDIHEIYYEAAGNPDGQAVVFLHGGPGGGIEPSYRQYFNPEKYHIILFDQRGCGKSTPFSELRENTTWDLVSDIEKLRELFKIDKWAVFGGSWGSTLALSYASKYAKNISALFLRGIFLLRKKELDWFYQEGASKLFPDYWENYRDEIPEEERGDFLKAYHQRLTSEDPKVRASAAKTWSVWEAATSKLMVDPKHMENCGEDQFADAFARIESHYFINKGFLESENYLLEKVDEFRKIPAVIVQGRYDVVCAPITAWELHKAWPEAKFEMVPTAGHSVSEPGVAKALVTATDKFAETGTI
ncbi:MAG: prolyl aminopeptidase [Bdellovibrionales bacterium]